MLVWALPGQANTILFMAPVITTGCLNVCPDLTTGLGDGIFSLVGPTTLRGALFATFQVPGSYQGGQLAWTIGAVGSSVPLATGPISLSNWDEGPVTVSGISLEEYYENFSLGAGVVLTAGSYYLQITDPAPTPDHFGIFWATNAMGLAFSLEGSGNQGPAPPTVPEPTSLVLSLAGIAALGWWASRRRSRPSL